MVASGVLLAGGNIAPAAPVTPAAAPAACDFWGSLDFVYDAQKLESGENSFKKDSEATLGIALGVEKDLGNGFGFGAELGAKLHRNYKLESTGEEAELSQLYLSYKTGNTAIKIGRQALPDTLSPWAWSDRDAGVLDTAYNGIVLVNTDIADTTLVAAWIASTSDMGGTTKIDTANGSNKGLFMLAAEYKGIKDTTLRTSAYYVPKFLDTDKSALSFWASGETKVGSVDLGLQVGYAKAKAFSKSFGINGYIGTEFDNFDLKLSLAYLNDGGTTLALGGANGLWIDSDVDSTTKQKIAKVEAGYTFANDTRLYTELTGNKKDTGSTELEAKLGYEFKVSKMDAVVEYTYAKDNGGNKDNTIEVEFTYNF